jgi:hypothetical protein
VFATPFVQGRLRKEFVSVAIKTECAHCARPVELKIDSDLTYRVKEEGCAPIVFVPDIDLLKLEEASIINAF